jgi:hypothetical protein
VSTRADTSGTATDDSQFTATQQQLASWLAQRDKIAKQIEGLVEGAEFGGQDVNEQQAKSLTARADALIQEVRQAAG